MTRVLFDLAATQGYMSTKFHGGGEYAKRIFRECVSHLPDGTTIEAHLESSRFTDPLILEFAIQHSILLHYVDSSSDLELLLQSGGFDRYYSALPVDARWEFKVPPTTKFIFTLHGVRGILTQDWRLRTKYGRNVLHGIAMATFFFLFGRSRLDSTLRRVSRKISASPDPEIITDSNYGKFSFTAALPALDLSHMKVLEAPADGEAPTRDPGILARASLQNRKFFLVASANRYEKNGFRSLRALDMFFTDVRDDSNYRDLRVAVTGLKPNSRLVRLLRLRNPDRFEFLDYVSPGEMEELYASANALVYASLSEGYGYPPVEAMRYETPSICSGSTSIPEICGDAAIYFNPYDVEEIVARLYEIVDPEARASLDSKLLPRARVIRKRQDQGLAKIRAAVLGEE